MNRKRFNLVDLFYLTVTVGWLFFAAYLLFTDWKESLGFVVTFSIIAGIAWLLRIFRRS